MNFDTDLLAAERAIDEVRCGRPVAMGSEFTLALYGAVETIGESSMNFMHELGGGCWSLIVTPKRACALGLGEVRSEGARVLRLRQDISLPSVVALASSAGTLLSDTPVPRSSTLGGGAGNGCDRSIIDLLKAACANSRWSARPAADPSSPAGRKPIRPSSSRTCTSPAPNATPS